ncbi:cullin family protein, partial [Cardiosporidium cionae]
ELRRVHTVFSRNEEGLSVMSQMFRTFVIKRGTVLVNACTVKLENATHSSQDINTDGFIHSILELNEYCKTILNECFCRSTRDGPMTDACFQTALKDAFECLINHDMGNVGFPEMLASFCDKSLQNIGIIKILKRKSSEMEAEKLCNQCADIFDYIADKDLFAGHYKSLLARRLLNETSYSQDLEKSMITQLKSRCGAQYTAKLEGMLSDLSAANDLKLDFSKYLHEHTHSLELLRSFSVRILSMAHWPAYPINNANLPASMQECINVFEIFYKNKMVHHLITWALSIGKILYELDPH